MVMPVIQYAPEECSWCQGKGRWGNLNKICPTCNGMGSVLVAQPARECPHCHGRGSVGEFDDRCPVCNGAGWAHVLPNQSLKR
ncbi:MAG TPA: transcriptional regulator [Anaerolineales bacterium]|nr:transcriptional regulator [Anaerolineales bacterium]